MSLTKSTLPAMGYKSRSFARWARAGYRVESRAFDSTIKRAASPQTRGMGDRPLRTACAIFFLMVMSSLMCYSADVVLIRSAGRPSSEQRELELATQFYGVNLRVVEVSANNAQSILDAVRQSATVAVVIEADSLAAIDQKPLLRALHQRPVDSVPLLIAGVTPETSPTLLRSWSGGAALGAKRFVSPTDLHYLVGDVGGITQQLTNLAIPFRGNETFYFSLGEHSGFQEIMAIGNDRQVVPVFIEADLERQKVFLLCKERPSSDDGAEWKADSTVSAFAEIAPLMIFAKYSVGDRGWHALHHYANLTIDDPWLREPYGHLAYKDLLPEMEKHNFHTTIAFIPWNYDRSQAPVVTLFRNHPERFSICVHGDNHDHKEFDDFGSKPLGLQIAAIKQSLARMERFQALTGIPYDNVFVFPHNIGSESILEALKTYNFAATVNSLNVPMDRARPVSPFFALRPVTVSFGDFPSISRYSASMPTPDPFIGINDFLDNPLFFYGHHDLFASGISAFDGMADEVNKLQPDTRWRSLGDVARNLYLVRLRDDSNYDVLTFSSSLDLKDISGRTAIFDVQKQEADASAIAGVSVDGQSVPFEISHGYLHLTVRVPAGESRSVAIRYKNDYDLASISTSKNSPRVYLLRTVSDFRDITLSKYSVGRTVVDSYYKHAVLSLVVIGLVMIVVGICGVWTLRVVLKRRTSAVLRSEMATASRTARVGREGFTVSNP